MQLERMTSMGTPIGWGAGMAIVGREFGEWAGGMAWWWVGCERRSGVGGQGCWERYHPVPWRAILVYGGGGRWRLLALQGHQAGGEGYQLLCDFC
jgi:hypothetical protein